MSRLRSLARAHACRFGLAFLLLALPQILATEPASGGGGESATASEPGAYCPLPEKGEVPVCLTPAQAEYGAFFAGLESGEIDEAQTAALEADLASGDETERAYLALSSISYGYYRLAQRLSEEPEGDPVLLARLEHWNQLLRTVYAGVPADGRFQQAVQQAAVDLHRRSPAVGETCGAGAEQGCEGAEGLVRALAAIDSRAGLRSPLTRLVNRLFGDGAEAGDAR